MFVCIVRGLAPRRFWASWYRANLVYQRRPMYQLLYIF